MDDPDLLLYFSNLTTQSKSKSIHMHCSVDHGTFPSNVGSAGYYNVITTAVSVYRAVTVCWTGYSKVMPPGTPARFIMTALSRACLACILLAGVSQGWRDRQRQAEAKLNITNGRDGDDLNDSGPLQRLQRHSRTSDTHSSILMHGAASVAAVVIKDAVVLGVVAPAEAEAEAEHNVGDRAGAGRTGASRALMSMQRKPMRLAVCPQCSIRRCRGDTCTGFCRKRMRVFRCRAQRPAADPVPCVFFAPNAPFPPVDELPPSDSLVVTAPAPFIGCAHIAGRAAGIACPPAGTRGTMHGGGASSGAQYEVTSSTCYREDFFPRCRADPYYPVGVCLCTRRTLSGQDLGTDACDVTELELSGIHGTAAVPVEFEDRGEVTYTGISDYTEPFDEPQFTHAVGVRVTAVEPEVDVNVYLYIFVGDELDGEYYDYADDYYYY